MDRLTMEEAYGEQAKRRLALDYARAVLDGQEKSRYSHALRMVTASLEQADDELARHLVDCAPVIRARQTLGHVRRPDRCTGSARFVSPLDVIGLDDFSNDDRDGVACPECGWLTAVERVHGSDRWVIVAEHDRPAEPAPVREPDPAPAEPDVPVAAFVAAIDRLREQTAGPFRCDPPRALPVVPPSQGARLSGVLSFTAPTVRALARRGRALARRLRSHHARTDHTEQETAMPKEAYDHIDEAARKANERREQVDADRAAASELAAIRAAEAAKDARDGGR